LNEDQLQPAEFICSVCWRAYGRHHSHSGMADNVVPQLSVITRIELPGWPQIPAAAKEQITAFIADAVVYYNIQVKKTRME
jgi:hypothetical protein